MNNKPLFKMVKSSLLNGDPILDFDVEMSNAGDEDVSRSSVVGDNNSDVNVNINVELTASILLESAKEDLDRKKTSTTSLLVTT